MTVEGGQSPGTGLVDRVRGILLSPKAEWDVIEAEPATIRGLYTGYIMILAAVPAIIGLLGSLAAASFLGSLSGRFGVSVSLSPAWIIVDAIVNYALGLVVLFVMALIIDGLAPSFGAIRGRVQALKVVAYSGTAIWVSSITLIIPILGFFVVLAGLIYTVYLIYLGLRQVMQSPEDKAVGYTAVTVILSIVAAFIIYIIASIPLGIAKGVSNGLFGMFGAPAAVTVKLPDGTRIDTREAERAAREAAAQIEAGVRDGTVTINTGATTEAGALTELMPASLPGGFDRTEISGGGIEGLAMGAEAIYRRGGSKIELNIADMGAMGALGGLAASVTSDRQTATGYEKMGKVNGRMTIEEYDRSDNSGKYGVMVANRFMVEAEGEDVLMNDLKAAIDAVPLGRLEAMAKN